jgi:hypothetical protein
MRKQILAVALCAAAVAIPAGQAVAAPAIQTIDSVLANKETPKLDKKKFKKTSVEVETTTADAANPAGMPPKATTATIKFDKKDVKFNTKAVPGCSQAQLANTTTEAATAACGKAIVGGGNATAALPLGVGGTRTDFPVVVTAFNRSDAKGILLHSRANAPLNTTTVLTGTLAGTTLSLQIPPLGGGVGAIAQFQTKVKAKDYVQGRCKSKKIKTDSTFTFTDAPAANASDTQKCKQKKTKKRK